MKKLSAILLITILIVITGQSIIYAEDDLTVTNKEVTSRVAPSNTANLHSSILNYSISKRVLQNYKKGVKTTVIGLKGVDTSKLEDEGLLAYIADIATDIKVVKDGDMAKLTITASEIDKFKRTPELEDAENKLIAEANSYSSIRDKLAYINDKIIETTTYGDNDYSKSAYGVFCMHEAVCSGFAKAARDICEKLGVKWSYIFSHNHISTMVYVDGQWCLWDLTWETGTPETINKEVIVDIIQDGNSMSVITDLAKRQYFLVPLGSRWFNHYISMANPNNYELGNTEAVYSILYSEGCNVDLDTALQQYEIDPKLIKDTSEESTNTAENDNTPFVSTTRIGIPINSTVMVNGKKVAFDAYTIDGNNYFKLRDIAMAIRGTKKQFEVKYDNTSKAINIIPGLPYTPVGGELTPVKLSVSYLIDNKGRVTTIKKATNKAAIPTVSTILKNGEEMKGLSVYTIAGSNYFKLRDLADQLGFSVDYNNTTKVITINSK